MRNIYLVTCSNLPLAEYIATAMYVVAGASRVGYDGNCHGLLLTGAFRRVVVLVDLQMATNDHHPRTQELVNQQIPNR